MKQILITILLVISLNCFSQYNDSIRIVTLEKQTYEINKALVIYGKQNVIANYITIVSFTTVIGGTILGAPTAKVLLVTGLCDLATLIITGRAARRLAHKKL